MASPGNIANKVDEEVRNFVRLTTHLARGDVFWDSRPIRLEYSFNTACNLRCVMCHQSLAPPVERSDRGLGAALLAWFGAAGTLWTPSATSEPLANRLDDLLQHAEAHGLFLELITNAVPLEPAVLERLLPRLHRLTVSIDSHQPEVLERIRPPARFEVLRANAAHALQRCRELGIPTQVHCVLLRENAPLLADFVDFAADLGAQVVVLLDLLENSPAVRDHDPWLVHSSEEMHAFLGAMRERARRRQVGLRLDLRAPFGDFVAGAATMARVHSGTVMETFLDTLAREHAGFCPMVASYLKVTPDGTAYPCCRAPRELVVGNVFEQGVDAVWNGAPMQALRRRMFQGDLPQPCIGCTVREGPIHERRVREGRPEDA